MTSVRNPRHTSGGFEAFVAANPTYTSHLYRFPLATNPDLDWTLGEDELLRLWAASGAWTTDIAYWLGRSISAVYARAWRLGISLMPPDPPVPNPYLWS